MSIRTYNSSKSLGRFLSKSSNLNEKRKKNIDYTQIYKLDGVPVHDMEAMRQYAEKRDEYQRTQNMLKRKMEKEKFEKRKKNNCHMKRMIQNGKKRIMENNDIEIIKKKNRSKIRNSIL